MKQYNHIRAWGRYMGSYQYYIDDQVERARKDNAPEDALYKDVMTGKWMTFDQVTVPHVKFAINFILKDMGVL